jgi:hypothetical protein
MQCSPFFADDPTILWKEMNDFFPFHARARRCTSVALNSFTRFGLLLGLLLTILRVDARYIIISFLFPILSVAAYYGMKAGETVREGFKSRTTSDNLIEGSLAADKVVADIIGVQERTLPNGPNPFMTVLMDEVHRGAKPPAVNANTPEVKKELDAYFQTSIYSDPGDVFQRNQSQRQFVVPASTSIPNDGNSYQNWLYRVPEKTCKEGNRAACMSRNDSGRMPHLT